MREARPDARYFPIYFTPDDHPLMQEMFAHLLAAIGDGSLQPLRHRVFPIAQAGDAFRFMAQAKHIGKVLVKLADAPAPAAAIRADATYLVTGGLGALGLTVARWLVEEGAKHLLLVGRSSPSTTTVAVLDDLRRLGAEVVVEQADISRREDVRRLFDSGSMPAVRGIVHTAGVNDDAVLSQQTWDRFDRVLAPKMRGTWNLHEAVEGRELDFFVCFSSMVSLFGGPGQANYAAANGFLDGFARYRRSRGLPALAINWGPWAGEGMAGRVSERDRQRWRAEGYGMIPPSRGAATLGALLRHAGAGIAAVPVDWPVLLRGFTPGTEPPILRDLSAAYAKRPAAAKDSGRRRLADLLASVPSNRKRAAIAEFLRTEALKVLGLDAAAALDERQPLSELGLDSLMAVELRNAIAAAMERTLPATLLFKHPTLEGLTQFVSSELGADAATAPELDADARSVAAMSDDEAKALLAAELESLTDLAAEET